MTSPSPRRIRTLLAALVLAALTATLLAGTAVQPASAAKPPFTITVKLSQARGEVGRPLTIAGYVKPAKKGLPVILQKRGQGATRWVQEARGTMSATGRYSFTTKPSTAGLRYYRVVVPASATRRTTASQAAPISIYRWIDLPKFPVRESEGTFADSAVEINGVTYGRAYRGYNQYYDEGLVDWNFDRKCLTLQGRLGNSDESDALARATINITADGSSLYQRSFGLTESVVKTST